MIVIYINVGVGRVWFESEPRPDQLYTGTGSSSGPTDSLSTISSSCLRKEGKYKVYFHNFYVLSIECISGIFLFSVFSCSQE